jgi:transposase
MRERRRFSREYKAEAVALAKASGGTSEEVARSLEIRADMLRRWKREVEEEGSSAFPGSGRLVERDEEVRRLERQLRRVTMERDILKKALGIVSEEH